MNFFYHNPFVLAAAFVTMAWLMYEVWWRYRQRREAKKQHVNKGGRNIIPSKIIERPQSPGPMSVDKGAWGKGERPVITEGKIKKSLNPPPSGPRPSLPRPHLYIEPSLKLAARYERLRQWGETRAIVVQAYSEQGRCTHWACLECSVVHPAQGYRWCQDPFPHKESCILHET